MANSKKKGKGSDTLRVGVISAVTSVIVALIAAGSAILVAGMQGYKSSSGAVVPPSPATSSAGVDPIPIFFTLGSVNWYLDVLYGSTSPGTPVTPWDANPTTTGKKWYFYPADLANPNGEYVIVNGLARTDESAPDGDMVLTYNPGSGTLTIKNYSPNSLDQEWSVDSGMLHNAAADGLCLAYSGKPPAVSMQSCGGNNSNWNIPDNP